MQLVNLTKGDVDAVHVHYAVLDRGRPDWARHFEKSFDYIVFDPHECGAPCAIACTWQDRYGPRVLVMKMRPAWFGPVDGAEILRHESDHVRFDKWGRQLKNVHTVFTADGKVDQVNDPIYRRGIFVRKDLERAAAELAPKPAVDAGPTFGQVVGALATGAAVGAGIGIGISILAEIFGGSGGGKRSA